MFEIIVSKEMCELRFHDWT